MASNSKDIRSFFTPRNPSSPLAELRRPPKTPDQASNKSKEKNKKSEAAKKEEEEEGRFQKKASKRRKRISSSSEDIDSSDISLIGPSKSIDPIPQSLKKSKRQKTVCVSSSDDEAFDPKTLKTSRPPKGDKESPVKKAKKQESRKKAKEEEVEVKEEKKKEKSKHHKDGTRKDKKEKPEERKESKKTEEVNPLEFFGSTKVKETKIAAEPQPVKPAAKTRDKEIHADDEFNELLEKEDVTKSDSTFQLKMSKSKSIELDVSPDKKSRKSPRKTHSEVSTKKIEEEESAKKMKSPEKMKSKEPSPRKELTPTQKKASPKENKRKDRKEKARNESAQGSSKDTADPAEDETASIKEKRKSAGYFNYMNREPPKALGSKEIPEGAPNCFVGLKFVVTGVLESIEREETETLIKKYGGNCTGGPSKKTSYVIAGRDPGPSKISKAKDLGLKIIDEDGFFDLIRSRSEGKMPKTSKVVSPTKESKPVKSAEDDSQPKSQSKYFAKPASTSKNTMDSPLMKKIRASPEKVDARKSPQKSAIKPESVDKKAPKVKAEAGSKVNSTSSDSSPVTTELSWVDKYKPTNLSQIIGQHGDKSAVKKLLFWLRNWHQWHLGEGANQKRAKPPPWKAGSDDGNAFKAALLSGPPGIGKTTSAILCCKELGLDYLELNASDTRKKKTLEEVISQKVGTHGIREFASVTDTLGVVSAAVPSSSSKAIKQVLIMDEVDGMSGNEDRAGMSELLNVIKKSKFPIICICNDRQSQKIRSLANHCFDLRFPKPRIEQIKGRLMSIVSGEGMKLEPQALEQIIEGANQDVRQIIQHLNLLSVGLASNGLQFHQARSAAQAAKKDVAVNVFESGRQLLSGKQIDPKRSQLIEKSDLFFMDYSLMPLFVHENYFNLIPGGKKNESEHLALLSDAAESIAFGDIIDRKIRMSQAWSLLPQQAMFSAVLPTMKLNGHLAEMLQFPSWLGRNSTRNKRLRIAQQLQHHMNLKTSSDLNSLVLDYVPYIRDGLTLPISRDNQGPDGVASVVSLIESYDLTSEDRDNIVTELNQWPGMPNIQERIDSKVKSAVTRTLNKDHKMLPYASGEALKGTKKRTAAIAGAELDEEGNPIGEGTAEESDDSDSEDRRIAEALRKKKSSTAKAKGTSSSTRGKGGGSRGRGRGGKK